MNFIGSRSRAAFTKMAAGASAGAVVSLLLAANAFAAPELNPVFSDHMVLQRNAPITVWGTAAPGERISVTLGKASETAVADDDGRWRAELPSMKKGGPFELTVENEKNERQSVSDIHIGDVFLCSGQSNMAWPVSQALNPQWELQNAANDAVRLYKIQRATSARPQTEFANPSQWKVSGPESAADFSALCFFFAREILETADAPIGLIDSSWGGSQIEAWIGADALRKGERFDASLDLLEIYNDDPGEAKRRFAERWVAWWKEASPAPGLPWEEDASRSGWRPAPAEKISWQDWGVPELAEHNGMVWFRTEFSLTEAQASQDATLSLGGVDELDMNWINGRFVGGEFGWGDPRRYEVSADALRPGKNELFVNVYSSWGGAGMYGPDERMTLSFPDGSTVSISDDWRYLQVPAEKGAPPQAPWEPISGLTGLYNAMIAPLGDMKLKGALWYQGESNTGRADEYEELLRLMIDDWRSQFGEKLPFIVIQLPDFGAIPESPQDSGWARLRDEQRRAAASDPLTGLVVAIDLGDPSELHPPNKQAVAKRAAAIARDIIYGEGDAGEAPSPKRAHQESDRVVVEFDNLTADAKIVGAPRPIAFELCDDAGHCRFVDADLDGGKVSIATPENLSPAFVRYCWGDAPVCNWRDRSGVPVTPFEIEIE